MVTNSIDWQGCSGWYIAPDGSTATSVSNDSSDFQIGSGVYHVKSVINISATYGKIGSYPGVSFSVKFRVELHKTGSSIVSYSEGSFSYSISVNPATKTLYGDYSVNHTKIVSQSSLISGNVKITISNGKITAQALSATVKKDGVTKNVSLSGSTYLKYEVKE